LTFSYPEIPPLVMPDHTTISLLEPKIFSDILISELEIIQEGLRKPIGLAPLQEMVKGKQ